MLIARYITKEIGYNFIAIIGVLLLVSLSNQFIVYLGRAASGQLPLAFVFKIIGLYIPELFGSLAPLGLYIAILFSHGRLHADSESTVLLVCGYSWQSLINITLRVGLFIAILVACLTIWLNPRLMGIRENIVVKGEAVGMLHCITPGRFQTIDNGRLVFYAEDVDNDGNMQQVFIAEKTVMITAKEAAIIHDKQDGKYYLVLRDGQRYVGKPGSLDYTVVSFAEYGQEIQVATTPTPDFQRLKPSGQLYNSDKVEDRAEWQWRLSIPLSVLILSLLAIALARVQPREGRFAKFFPAILLYIAYYNIMTVVKRQHWSLWWVHGVFFTLSIILLLNVMGYLDCYKRALRNYFSGKRT